MEKKIFSIVIIFLFFFLNGCIENGPNQEPKTIYVNRTGQENFTKIQQAIDFASDGDTIFVKNGKYNELLLINKTLNIIGESKEKTIIEIQQNINTEIENIVFINSNGCTFKQFKIIGTGSSTNTIAIKINSSFNNISDNILINNHEAIRVGKIGTNTYKNSIYSNFISNCFYGINIRYSDNNNISRNNVSLCTHDGIILFMSENNIVFSNTINNSRYFGIRVKSSDKNTVFGNLLFKNKGGIYCCCGSGENIIYHNTLTQNIDWNARDDINNQWDNGFEGNYWDDYKGIDADNNGIGDIPYNFSYASKDNFPFIEPIAFYNKEI
jgi:parallel beta-helix repeat protein